MAAERHHQKVVFPSKYTYRSGPSAPIHMVLLGGPKPTFDRDARKYARVASRTSLHHTPPKMET